MARGPAIKKDKEVEKMKCVAFLAMALVAAIVLAPLHRIDAEPRPPVIVVLGDSLTSGLGLPRDQAFPAQLETALKARGREVTVINCRAWRQ
jgi:acyl-CoA thioesterase-1